MHLVAGEVFVIVLKYHVVTGLRQEESVKKENWLRTNIFHVFNTFQLLKILFLNKHV